MFYKNIKDFYILVGCLFYLNVLNNKKSDSIKLTDRKFFFNEKIYVEPKKEIKKIIHQIWVGKALDKKSLRFNLMKNVKTLEKNGYEYKCWTDEDLIYEMKKS